MEAILPLKISGDWSEFDLQRAAMLVFSRDRFWTSSKPLKLHVIARTEDVSIVQSALSAQNVAIDVVDENALLPCLASFSKVGGWQKQQLIKLASHKIVSSEHMLVLDADLFCCRAISELSFIDDGKLLADWESRTAHEDWWQCSAAALGVEPNLDRDGIKPTPEVLVRQVCQRLEEHLNELHGDGWSWLLNHLGWTEFTLYNLFCDKLDCMTSLYKDKQWMHANNKGIRTHDCFSTPESFENAWNPERSLKISPYGHFMVCNSSTHVDPAKIWTKISPYVDGKPKLFGKDWPS